MKILLKTITPLHIGTGKKITPFEYVVDNRFFIKINSSKFLNFLSVDDKNDLLKAYESNNLPYIRYITLKLYEKLSDKQKKALEIYKFIVDESFEKIYRLKIGDKKQHNEANRLEIYENVKSLDGFYIPGSSLKGAIRTIILFSLAKNNKSKELENFKEISSSVLNKQTNQEKVKEIRLLSRSDTNDKIEKDILKYEKIWQDPFRFLIVRDSEIISFENGIVSKNYRLGKKGKLHTTKEYIKENVEINGEIIFNQRLFNLFKEKLGLNYNFNFTKEEEFKKYLIQVSNDYLKFKLDVLKVYIQNELLQLSEKNLNRGNRSKKEMYEKVLDNVSLISKEINNLKDNETILNLGFGGGYVFKKLDDLLIPDTYNFVSNKFLNGFIKLTFKD